MSILTDKELILIGEEPRRKNRKKNLYGAVFSYVPLQKIRSVFLSPVLENAHKTLVITLQGGRRQTLDFANDNKEIDDFYLAVQNSLGEDRWKEFRVSPL